MKIKMMQIGESGTGKTYNSFTFPKCFHVVTTMGEEDTVESRPFLKKNLVERVDFRPLNSLDAKQKFDVDNMRQAALCKEMDRAKQMAKEGKVETLVVDNFTFLAKYMWTIVEDFYPQYSEKKGVLDRRSMFWTLSAKLDRILLFEFINFPGHVIVNVHVKLEDEETLKKLPLSARQNPYMPAILGGIRHTIKANFSLVTYLEKVRNEGKIRYFARTDLGSGKMARSRYPLPEIMENLSYGKIMELIQKSTTERR